jgi:hypothetical protein
VKYGKPRPMGRVPDGLSVMKIRGFRMRPVAKLRKIVGYGDYVIRFFRRFPDEASRRGM